MCSLLRARDERELMAETIRTIVLDANVLVAAVRPELSCLSNLAREIRRPLGNEVNQRTEILHRIDAFAVVAGVRSTQHGADVKCASSPQFGPALTRQARSVNSPQ